MSTRRHLHQVEIDLDRIQAEVDDDTAWALGLDHPPFEDADPAEWMARKDNVLVIQAARCDHLIALARGLATALAPFA